MSDPDINNLNSKDAAGKQIEAIVAAKKMAIDEILKEKRTAIAEIRAEMDLAIDEILCESDNPEEGLKVNDMAEAVKRKVSAHLSSALSYNRSLAAHSTALGR
ncbi:hypothetical protein J5X91_14800 [Pseudoalteromonas sp. K222D]|uniref:hypothetical protein n=1 Tax=Pseudoalteromonas sp. K222D TaxID=2820756 RepID=UPI001AD7CC2E|nr:hypothetical protein [Pseudoalteromonas sp. K222D]MBO7927515.1 hypothetical protein [Pseudoalteromonas sp. K222D]